MKSSTKEQLAATHVIFNMHFNDVADKNTVLTPEHGKFAIEMEYLNKIIALAEQFFHMSWNGPNDAEQWYVEEILEYSEQVE